MKNFSSPLFDANNLSTTNPPSPYGTQEYNIMMVVFLSVVMVLGFIGNSAVFCTLLQRQRQSACATNSLLMNISVADLLVAVIVIPLSLVRIFYNWPLGHFLCHTLAPFQDVIACVSVVSHTVIAMERYRAIVEPFKRRLSTRGAKQAIVIIWLLCCTAIGLPMALVLRVSIEGGALRCKAQWSSDLSRQIFEVYLVLVFMLLPLAIQTYAYIYIVKTVDREIIASAESGTDQERLLKAAMSKARVVKMLILLVVAFYLLSLPRVLTMLWVEFGSSSFQDDVTLKYAVLITIAIYCVQYVINPFIIFASSAELRASCWLLCYRVAHGCLT